MMQFEMHVSNRHVIEDGLKKVEVEKSQEKKTAPRVMDCFLVAEKMLRGH